MLEGELPQSLLPIRLKQDGAWHHFSIHEYADVERTLADLRKGGATITKMEVTEPDLEEVFLKVMHR